MLNIGGSIQAHNHAVLLDLGARLTRGDSRVARVNGAGVLGDCSTDPNGDEACNGEQGDGDLHSI